jgi:crossover junction endodeoxyribonuclease RusA
MIRLTLPWPPSTNTYYRNVGARTLLSQQGREYAVAVAHAVIEQGSPSIEGRLWIHIKLHPPDRRARDIDNFVKATIDAIKKAEAYEDDEQVDLLTVERCEIVAGGRADVMIDEISTYRSITP